MMYYLIAILSGCSASGQSAFTKLYTRRDYGSGTMTFNAVKAAFSVMIFALIGIDGFSFHFPTVVFGVGYGMVLFAACYFGYMALSRGSMALTSLIVSYSVIIPCIFGMFVLNETFGLIRGVGFTLVLISIYLLSKKSGGGKIDLNFVMLTFLCNGICSVIQKLHQSMFPAMYVREFMVFAGLVVFVLFGFLALVHREKTDFVKVVKFSVPAGVFMALTNFLPLFLASKLDAIVLFPIISISTVIANLTVSVTVFGDKFTLRQAVGIVSGVLSVILINCG